MKNCRYENKNGTCGLKGSHAYRHKCYTTDSCKCWESPTNEDLIRAMTAEELAAIICAEFTAEKIPFCQNKEECMKILESDTIPEEMCRACALNWLQQPAKEDE